jgi:Flp pilus assembly protein TadG
MTYHNVIRDQRGTAALEFVLITLALLTVVFAVAGFGDVAQRQIGIQSAVRAGGEYARFFPTDQAGIQNAVTNALPTGTGWTLSAGPTVTCSCAGGGFSPSLCTSIANGTLCGVPFLINVSASLPVSTVRTPLWSGSFNNSASYEVRIQ